MRLLADTQVLIWYVLNPEKLSLAAADELAAEAAANTRVGVSAHALVGIAYASEKRTNPLTDNDVAAIHAVLHDNASPFEIAPLDLLVTEQVRSVPRADNADPGDRIVVATGEVLNLTIVSSDRKIPSMTSQPVVW